MPLTPEDVQNKEFTTVRLREGYDMQEVDEFLDEVEAELARMQRENDELRDKLGAVTRGGGVAASAEPGQAQRQPEAPSSPQAPPSASTPAASTSGTGAAAQGSGGQPSDAAAKVLALAQKTADELVADAKSEADRLMSEAKSRSEKLDSETKAKAAKIEQDARQRAESIEQEVQQRRTQVFGKLESDRADLERELETLRAFEREYRSRLKSYLERELRKLETGGVDEAETGDAGTGQLPAEPAGSGGQAGTDTQSGGGGQAAAAASGGQATQSGGQNTGGQGSGNSAAQQSGSLRSVASLLDDEQH
ncbi:DivIVA domain-containing protein [Haloactinopolyspora alba]|uniref:Cell wall synthesis protein Wag31 n=1 Tax=Haloactinopolyspora alba TaxID=648780 RepID=A0A2P8E426_9ACTN|nr:DivIVA domain-containing protein [Haloactinopolyspora alba]PSL04214.1 DivIVA domain-containing protein [Haloactinopolyspora alba]